MKRLFARVERAVWMAIVVALLFAVAPAEAYASVLHGGWGHWEVSGAHVVTVVTCGNVRATLQSGFDPVVTIEPLLDAPALGLPGDPMAWAVRVTNLGSLGGENLMLTDVLPDELRVDGASADRGEVVVSEHVVVLTVSTLAPGESVTLTIHTTVLGSPAAGMLVNQALLTADSAAGPVTRKAVADVYVPSGLPATGYAPVEDLPGDGEPLVLVVALGAAGVVLLTALFVWRRGQRAYRL